MPQRDGLLPWLSAVDNAALALRIAGRSRAQARAAAHPVLEELGLAGFEDAGPRSSRAACASASRWPARSWPARPSCAWTSRSARSDAITRAETQAWLGEVLTREPRTVLLVTHDVEEAAVLADRIVVLSPRPARVTASLEVPLARPRRATDPEVVAVRARALAALEA
jgi:NitT/TauT family transport system ATP-binding protein